MTLKSQVLKFAKDNNVKVPTLLRRTDDGEMQIVIGLPATMPEELVTKFLEKFTSAIFLPLPPNCTNMRHHGIGVIFE